MSRLSRFLCATVLAIIAFLALLATEVPAIAGASQMRVLHNGQSVHLLAPGADFSVVTGGLGAGHATYCLGLISLQDR